MDKIAIWGAGKIGRECYLNLKDKYEVVAFYDNDPLKWGKQIDGIPILRYDNQPEYIVISTIYWKEISECLGADHLELVKDFMPWWMFEGERVSFVELRNMCSQEQIKDYFLFIKQNKKIAMVYGNCQTRMISKMLMFHDEFKDAYMMIDIPLIYELDNYPKGLDKEIANDDNLWSNVDLFIYQKISLNNRFSTEMSTDYLLTKIRDDCLSVCIINIYFDGYFPQCKRLAEPIVHSVLDRAYWLYDDIFLDKEIEKQGVENIDKILQIVSDENYLDGQKIIESCDKSLQELKKREVDVDVRISDYIEERFMEEQLFFSFDHPNNQVLFEYVNRILNYLGLTNNKDISETDLYLLFGTLKSADMLIYPCIIKTLQLKQYEKYYYPNRGVDATELLDFEMYQRMYIEYRWKSNQLMEEKCDT